MKFNQKENFKILSNACIFYDDIMLWCAMEITSCITGANVKKYFETYFKLSH